MTQPLMTLALAKEEAAGGLNWQEVAAWAALATVAIYVVLGLFAWRQVGQFRFDNHPMRMHQTVRQLGIQDHPLSRSSAAVGDLDLKNCFVASATHFICGNSDRNPRTSHS